MFLSRGGHQSGLRVASNSIHFSYFRQKRISLRVPEGSQNFQDRMSGLKSAQIESYPWVALPSLTFQVDPPTLLKMPPLRSQLLVLLQVGYLPTANILVHSGSPPFSLVEVTHGYM